MSLWRSEKKKLSAPAKTKSFQKSKSKLRKKGGQGEAQEETVSSSIGTKNAEFYKPPPLVLSEELLPLEILPGPSLVMRRCSIELIKIIKSAMGMETNYSTETNSSTENNSTTEINSTTETESKSNYTTATNSKNTKTSSRNDTITNSIILTGQEGVGKSVLLLQTVNYALCEPCIVIYISDGIKYVNSTYPYIKNAKTDEFVQPTLAKELCNRIKLVNRRFLEDDDHEIGRVIIKQGSNITKLLDIGINDSNAAQLVFEIFLEEISNNNKYPVLLAVDAINAFYTVSEYTDMDNKRMEAVRLSLPRTILEYFSGHRRFARGAVIGAMSHVDKAFLSKPLDLALGFIKPSPWVQYSPNILKYTEGLKIFDVPTFTRDEAKSVMNYYRESSIIDHVHDQLFERYYIATNGIPRKFYVSCCKGL
ncbi:11025_t:CDS:10 [Diversispora eburnea]|uniref:Small ribosomal subunit protein mS29 n=1 Tax=Diversispora eburnea TaxID=1213867 RepID=A0A9N8YLW5_9GLOM|nr:11025_t:CDS:10 [Diversispora eburnea]